MKKKKFDQRGSPSRNALNQLKHTKRKTPSRKPRVLWFNSYCLLDTSSGASISARQILKQLATSGYEVKAVGATIFDDPKGAVYLEGTLGDAISRKLETCSISDGDLSHYLLVTKSPTRENITFSELNNLYSLYVSALNTFKPDLVFFYGGTSFDLHIPSEARVRGIPSAAYLVNSSYLDSRWCRDVDLIVTDTQATSDFYKERQGFVPVPVGKFIDPGKVIAPDHKRQYATLINPSWAKGAGIVAMLAVLLEERRPDIVFEVVESRGSWSEVVRNVTRSVWGVERSELSNVIVTPNTDNISEVYGRSRIVLGLSQWWESGSRVLAEAMLNGIPAMVSNAGGSPEMVGEGGIVVDLPPSCHEAPYNSMPRPELLGELVQFLERVWDDEPFYLNLMVRALQQGNKLHRMEVSTQRLLEAFEPLLAKRAGDGDFKSQLKHNHKFSLVEVRDLEAFHTAENHKEKIMEGRNRNDVFSLVPGWPIDYPVFDIRAKSNLTAVMADVDRGVGLRIYCFGADGRQKKYADFLRASLEFNGVSYLAYDLGGLGYGEQLQADVAATPFSNFPSKPMVLQHALRTCSDGDVVVWLDADTWLKADLQDLSCDFDVAVTLRQRESFNNKERWINSGVVAIRKSRESEKFLNKWLELSRAVQGDQYALNKLVFPSSKETGYDGECKIVGLPCEIYNNFLFDGTEVSAKVIHYKADVRHRHPLNMLSGSANDSRVQSFGEELRGFSQESFLNVVQVGANDGRVNDPLYEPLREREFLGEITLIEPQVALHKYLKESYLYHTNTCIVDAAVGRGPNAKLFAIKPEYYGSLIPPYARSWPEYRAASGVTSASREHIVKWIEKYFPGKFNHDEIIFDFMVEVKSLEELLLSNGRLLDIDELQVVAEGFDDEVLYSCSLQTIAPKLINFECSHLSPERLIRCVLYLSQLGYQCRVDGSNCVCRLTHDLQVAHADTSQAEWSAPLLSVQPNDAASLGAPQRSAPEVRFSHRHVCMDAQAVNDCVGILSQELGGQQGNASENLTFLVCADGEYKNFVWPFVFFARLSNPGAKIEICLDDVSGFSGCDWLNFVSLGKGRPDVFRFCHEPGFDTEFVYICDIDILHTEDVVSFHLGALTENSFDNVERTNRAQRMSGLHFVRRHEWYKRTREARRVANIFGQDENELHKIVKTAYPSTRLKQGLALRPVHGIHCSLGRGIYGVPGWELTSQRLALFQAVVGKGVWFGDWFDKKVTNLLSNDKLAN